MKKILIGVDGSDPSKKAAKKGAELAKSFDSEVTLINIVQEITDSSASSNYPTSQTEELIERREAYMKRGQEILKEAKELVAEEGVTAKTKIKVGNPANLICDYAVENGFDLIVLADKGIAAVKRFLLGSITYKVVNHSETSVLIVK
ncbi:MAG: universal stress protein [Halarsenatibacteraceae bacterium]